ncbi:Os06g0208800, partial [Oryza sativa Japonica Group]
YALTAGNCVQCSCGPGDLKLYCTPASLTASCSSMQCPNSNLMLGNVTAQSTSGGCNVSSCSYAGLVNGTIATSLSSGLQPTCPGPHQFPPLRATPIAVNQGSYLAPSPAPGAGEAGGDIPGFPGSSNVSPANGPSGSVSQAASVNRPHQIVALILSVALYFQM